MALEQIRYHETWTNTHEISCIEHFGMERVFDVHGKYQGATQIKTDEEIMEILKGYIKGGSTKDWMRCGLDGKKCLSFAQNRLKAIKYKGVL